MKRRSFLTLLATLAAWVSMRPKLHADAVNASLRTAESPDRLTITLWDGETDVRVTSFETAPWVPMTTHQTIARIVDYYGREAFVYPQITMPASVTIFRLARSTPNRSGVEVRTYDYESGPKWWVPPTSFTDACGRQWEATQRACDEVHFRNGSTIRFGAKP